MARILVIDDEESIRTLMRRILERSGHRVFDARNGAEGLALFRDAPTDVVITDLVMPDMEGMRMTMRRFTRLTNGFGEAHAHGFDARVLVLDGSITLVFGKDRVTYGPGDSCSVPAGTVHEEHTDADGVRYVSGRRPVPHEAATRS